MFAWLKKLFHPKSAKTEDKDRAQDRDKLYAPYESNRSTAWSGTIRDARRSHPGGGPL